MRLTVLLTSPRVAPGLLSWPAWRAVADTRCRLASAADEPLVRAVQAAGFPVEVAPASVAGLLERAGGEDVVWLASDAEAERLPHELAAALVGGSGRPPDPALPVEVLHASYDVPGARLLDLVAVMDRLRTECPWDREQTHRSLAGYLLEETYETLEAIDSGDAAHLREELGDVLLQVVFHARIAGEPAGDDGGGFDIDDVAGGIVDKLVHRHPHVFAGLDVSGADEVAANWEVLKHAEKGRASVLEGVPMALPALALADKVLGRAAALTVQPPVEPFEALGARLLGLVVEARASGLDAEQELRSAVRRLAERVRAAERP